MNKDRLEWAIRTRQPMPLICGLEGISPEEYRAAKREIRSQQKKEPKTCDLCHWVLDKPWGKPVPHKERTCLSNLVCDRLIAQRLLEQLDEVFKDPAARKKLSGVYQVYKELRPT